jgi:hypothetical protein
VSVYQIKEVWWGSSHQKEGHTYLNFLSGRELEMDFDIMKAAIGLAPHEGGSTEGVLSVKAIWSPTVRKEHHDLVNRLGVL